MKHAITTLEEEKRKLLIELEMHKGVSQQAYQQRAKRELRLGQIERALLVLSYVEQSFYWHDEKDNKTLSEFLDDIIKKAE